MGRQELWGTKIDSPGLAAALEREAEKLQELLTALREARTALAELTLTGGGGRTEIERVEGRFRTAVAIARELQEQELD